MIIPKFIPIPFSLSFIFSYYYYFCALTMQYIILIMVFRSYSDRTYSFSLKTINKLLMYYYNSILMSCICIQANKMMGVLIIY